MQNLTFIYIDSNKKSEGLVFRQSSICDLCLICFLFQTNKETISSAAAAADRPARFQLLLRCSAGGWDGRSVGRSVGGSTDWKEKNQNKTNDKLVFILK